MLAGAGVSSSAPASPCDPPCSSCVSSRCSKTSLSGSGSSTILHPFHGDGAVVRRVDGARDGLCSSVANRPFSFPRSFSCAAELVLGFGGMMPTFKLGGGRFLGLRPAPGRAPPALDFLFTRFPSLSSRHFSLPLDDAAADLPTADVVETSSASEMKTVLARHLP